MNKSQNSLKLGVNYRAISVKNVAQCNLSGQKYQIYMTLPFAHCLLTINTEKFRKVQQCKYIYFQILFQQLWRRPSSPRNENLHLLVWNKFLNLFLYSFKKNLKNLLIRTKFCWSWVRGLVLIVRTDLMLYQHDLLSPLWRDFWLYSIYISYHLRYHKTVFKIVKRHLIIISINFVQPLM